MGKWCKWHHTTGISLSLWITNSSLGRTCAAACPAAPLAHRKLGPETDLSDLPFVRVCAAISDLVTPEEAHGSSALPVTIPDHACPSDHLVELQEKMGRLMNTGSIHFPRCDAGWCLCSGVECDLPVETLQFYFRPSHTQWERSRNVSPFNYSFSGPREILCICR